MVAATPGARHRPSVGLDHAEHNGRFYACRSRCGHGAVKRYSEYLPYDAGIALTNTKTVQFSGDEEAGMPKETKVMGSPSTGDVTARRAPAVVDRSTFEGN